MAGFIDFGARTIDCDPLRPDLVRVDRDPGPGQYCFDWRSGVYQVNSSQPWVAERAPALGRGRLGPIVTICGDALGSNGAP